MNQIKAVVFDFDGVFTDNKVILDENGKEYVVCSRYDGIGIQGLRKAGIKMCIISSEEILLASLRGRKLGLKVFQPVENKVKCLKEWANKENLDLIDIAYLGNDVNDLEAMQIVGYPFCPKDSHQSVIECCYVLEKEGGTGVVRELADMIIDKSI